MTACRADEIPPLVRRVRQLAAGARDGVMGETGTGRGVGTAWLASGISPAARLVTVEIVPELAAAAPSFFAEFAQVTVLTGDWREILAHAPFDLLFLDGGGEREHQELAVGALGVGGIAVLDDLTPLEHRPAEWRGQPDVVRAFWLNDARLVTAEVGAAPSSSSGHAPLR